MASKVTLKEDCPILDWIDREIVDTYKSSYACDELSNILLDLRHHFCCEDSYTSYNKLLAGFYKLLPALENEFYLLGYRIRRWIALNFTLSLYDPLDRSKAEVISVCQTLRSLGQAKKEYFERHDYSVPFHDIRVNVLPKAVISQA